MPESIKTDHRSSGSGPSRLVPFTLLFILFVFWSNSFHAIAYFRTTMAVSAIDLLTLRYGPVVPLCLVYLIKHRQKVIEMLRQDGRRLILVGLLTVPGYNLALNWGQGRVSPAPASLLISLNPVFTLLLAILFLREKARRLKILGFSIAFLGVYLLITTQQSEYGAGYSLAALVVLLAPLSWAIGTVASKPMMARCDPLLMTFTSLSIGSLPFFLAFICDWGGVHQILRTMPSTGWWSLIHLSLPCTVIGFAVWFWALRILPASTVAAFVFLNPPLTALFGAIWGTEEFHWSTAIYGLVILGGVALSSGVLFRRRRKERIGHKDSVDSVGPVD